MEGTATDGGAPSKIVPYGNFEDVIINCPALQPLWAKNAEGQYIWDISNPKGLFHQARYASMTFGMATKGGEEFLKRRWPGPRTESYIAQGKAAGYTPVTCKYMQENGICVVGKHPKHGDHCMKKIPPSVRSGGVTQINPDNLPEDQWKEPSPIRNSTPKHLTVDEAIESIVWLSEAKTKKLRSGPPDIDPASGRPIVEDSYTPDNLDERIEGLMRHMRTFPPEDQKKIQAAITGNNLMSKKELKEETKRIDKEIQIDAFTKRVAGKRSYVLNEKITLYVDDDEHYYSVSELDAKGIPHDRRISNFTVTIQEEHEVIRISDEPDSGQQSVIEDRYFLGVIHARGQVKLLPKIRTDDWNKSRDSFFRQIVKSAGTAIAYLSADYDLIRNCVHEFSHEGVVVKRICREIGHHKLQGGRDVYMMPSVIISKDEIKPNDEYVVEPLGAGSKRSKLDFALMSAEEAKDLSYHLINDYFHCNIPILTRTTFAHAMAAAITPQIEEAVGYRKAPTLFLAGSLGDGKTFVAESAQCFYGKVDISTGNYGSAKAKLALAYMFRHAMLLIDDYKQSSSDTAGLDIMNLIQQTYDRSERNTLKRDSSLKDDAHCARGLMTITGEEFPDKEASAVSRLILLDIELKANRERGDIVTKRRSEYSGFTAHFIHFVYQLGKDELIKMWETYFNDLHEPVKVDHANKAAGRICENLTLNMVAFRLSMELMIQLGVDPKIAYGLAEEHLNGMYRLRDTMIQAVSNAKGGNQFLDALVAMMAMPNKYRIHGWPYASGEIDTFANGSPTAVPIGFYKHETPDVVYIIPALAYPEANQLVSKGKESLQTKQHVSRQLKEGKHMDNNMLTDGTRRDCQRRSPQGGHSVRVWPILLTSVGVDRLKLVNPIPVDSGKKLPYKDS